MGLNLSNLKNQKIGVVRFLGTNCDADIYKWVEATGNKATYLWFDDQFNINDYDQIIIPGGFSYGDYLRCGALAARSAVMKSVREFASRGGPVLGICNGFQILCESELLPGALVQNECLHFKDEWSELKICSSKNFFGHNLKQNQKIKLPIAHGEGRFYSTADQLKQIQDQDLIWMQYENNPNGALLDIAGLTNKAGNVFGLMPHPERALHPWMGSTDGQFFL